MPDLYKNRIPIVRSSLNEGFLRGAPPPEELGYGAVPRDYDEDPVEMRDSPDAMKVYAESEWDALYDAGEKNEDTLEHLFLRGDKPAFQHLDQGRDGHCWAYSTGHAIMLDRLKQNLPLVRLNPHGVATMLRRFNGGWSPLSMKFAREHGYPVEGNGPGEWPFQSNNSRYDTPELRASMQQHKADEGWYDLGRREWDQNLSRLQVATCGFNNWPTPVDYNRAAHAMCQLRWVRTKWGWGSLIINSWPGFGYYGLAVLLGWLPNGAVSLRSSTPSAR